MAKVNEQITKVIAKIVNWDLRNNACKEVDWYKLEITPFTPCSLPRVKLEDQYELWNHSKHLN